MPATVTIVEDYFRAQILVASSAMKTITEFSGLAIQRAGALRARLITEGVAAEQLADEYGRRDLLKFGVRPDNLIDPACVVGVRRATSS